METFTIAELSARSGRTKKAIRNLCDRGALPFVVRDGLRRVPETAARQAGLLREAGNEVAERPRQPEAAPLPELLDKLAALAEENGRLKALAMHSEVRETQERREVDRLQQEVYRLRTQLASLEARPKWRRVLRLAARPEPLN